MQKKKVRTSAMQAFHGIIAGAADFHTRDHKFRRAIPMIVQYGGRNVEIAKSHLGPKTKRSTTRQGLKVANIHGLLQRVFLGYVAGDFK